MDKIRVHIDFDGKDAPSGPHMFVYRLAKALSELETVEITSRKPHIALGIIRQPARRGQKNVVRVDGCYYNKAISKISANKEIAEAIRKSDAVVYQSRFSQNLCERILKVSASRSTVIPNGIDQKFIRQIEPASVDAKTVFVSAAKWRESKRPRSILNGFTRAAIPDSKMVFIGEFDGRSDFVRDDIIFTGRLDSRNVSSYMRSASVYVHLCMIESCSNAVVEALSLGVPVVCNNIGGTRELVGEDGVVVRCDEKFRYRVIDQKRVDNLDPEIVAQGLRDCAGRQWSIHRPDLDISVTAKAYYELFRSLLDENV